MIYLFGYFADTICCCRSVVLFCSLVPTTSIAPSGRRLVAFVFYSCQNKPENVSLWRASETRDEQTKQNKKEKIPTNINTKREREQTTRKTLLTFGTFRSLRYSEQLDRTPWICRYSSRVDSWQVKPTRNKFFSKNSICRRPRFCSSFTRKIHR